MGGRGLRGSLTIRHAASDSSLTIYPFGATITSYTIAGEELLFTSTRAALDGSRPIRGGIPLAFPQFAAQGPLPMHGLARTAPWALAASGDGFVELALRDSEATRALWPHAFALTYRAEFAGPVLRTSLRVRNTGAAPFAFEALQHTYLAGGAGAVAADGRGALAVRGLQGATFFAKTGGGEAVDGEAEVRLGGEVDRVYYAPAGAGGVEVVGVGGRRGWDAVEVAREGRGAGGRAVPLDVVVWNPGPARAAAIADLGPEDWREFVCVEPGRVAGASAADGVLGAGEEFTLTQTLTARKRGAA